MKSELIHTICESRLIIGYLGEKHQAAWWDSSFLSSSASAFLMPIYPNSILLAQYCGVCQAASIVHDDLIGIGRHYHLFRLPNTIERTLSNYIQDNNNSIDFKKNITDKECAISRIKKMVTSTTERIDGPVIVGDYSDEKLEELLGKMLSHYVSALEHHYKAFPYMRCV